MRMFVYRALLEHGEKRGITVSFPDVPEAITQGRDRADALTQAQEALGLALLSYPQRGLPLPKAKARSGVPIAVEPDVAAKLALLEALRAAGISKSEFARRIGKDEKEARRILDPLHATKLGTLSEALHALGKCMIVGIEEMVH
jgi:antitoxin HicB